MFTSTHTNQQNKPIQSRYLTTTPSFSGDQLGGKHRAWVKRRERARLYFITYFEEKGFRGPQNELSQLFDKLDRESQELFTIKRNSKSWPGWATANDLDYLYNQTK